LNKNHSILCGNIIKEWVYK